VGGGLLRCENIT